MSNQRNLSYDPTRDALLLELHCLAFSAFDYLGEHDQARRFIDKWAIAVQFEAAVLFQEAENSGHAEWAIPKSKVPPFLRQKAWLLQQAGIAEYRISRFDGARSFLRDAMQLCRFLLNDEPNGLLKTATAVRVMMSACCYWLGCIETYANKFPDAERYFLEGLQLEAEIPGTGADDDSQDEDLLHFAKYNTGRLLLGLGLYRFHVGALDQARSSLLAARILLERDSRDRARQLRAELLLLSTERMEYTGDAEQKDKLEKLAAKLETLAQKFNREEVMYGRYFCRTRWTIGLVKLDLADLYRRTSDPLGGDAAESERTSALKAALRIADEQRSRAYGSMSDQLQLDILKLRVLRRLKQLDEAIKWGTSLRNSPKNRDHVLLYTEVLFALGHAYYERWREKKSDPDLTEAKKLFIEAGEVGRENPRAQAVCSLHLARIAQAQGLYGVAESEFDKWLRLSEVVKLRWIVKFGERVTAELFSGDVLMFSAAKLPERDVYDYCESKIRGFLLERIAPRTMPVEDALQKLGIARQTLYKWREEQRGKAQAAATTTD